MNAESEIIECERPESVDIDFPQMIQALRNLEQELTENQRIAEIHARFRELRCFQHILGTSTSFQMEFRYFVIVEYICVYVSKLWELNSSL